MVQSEMREEGKDISMKKLCKWFDVARSSVYYRPSASRKNRPSRALNQALTKTIRRLIEANPTYGVRRITAMVRRELQKAVNRKAVHRIMKLNGWQVRKKQGGQKTRAKEMNSQTDRPNERWAIDASSIFCGEDGWCPITAIIDCCDRCIVGWRLSSSGVSKHAAAALEEALVARREEIEPGKLMLRSDNGLIFGAKAFVAVAKEYGVEQEYITPYTPEQNGMVERFFRSLKEECVWQHHFKSRDEAFEIIAKWMDKYHTERPHSALGYLTPEAFRKEWKVA
jgi:putative transposase